MKKAIISILLSFVFVGCASISSNTSETRLPNQTNTSLIDDIQGFWITKYHAFNLMADDDVPLTEILYRANKTKELARYRKLPYCDENDIQDNIDDILGQVLMFDFKKTSFKLYGITTFLIKGKKIECQSGDDTPDYYDVIDEKKSTITLKNQRMILKFKIDPSNQKMKLISIHR